MKRIAIVTAISAIAGVSAPYAAAELNSGSSLQDVISFTNGLDERATNAYAKAEEGTIIRNEHDARMNEQSDRIYNNRLHNQTAPHYDNDRVVKTEDDLKDSITGAVMHDRNGDALKVRVIQKGSDDLTLRGKDGTGLHNVANGVADHDAVNISQLKGTEQNLSVRIDGQGEAIKAIDSAQQQESKDRIAGYEQNSDRITKVAEQKADKQDVQEVRDAAASESRERINADADHDRKIGDLYDTKANAAEVNEWLETKADKDDLAKETAQRQRDGDQMREDLSAHGERIDAAQKSADRAQDGVEQLGNVKADRAEVESVSGTANTARKEAKAAQAGADKANAENGRLDAVKADRSELKDAMADNVAYFNSELNDAQATNATARDNVLREANAHTDQKIDQMNHRIDKVEKKAVNGVAAAVALSQIPQAIHAGHGNIGIGSGFYHGSQAIAVGGSYRFDDNRTTAKFGVSRAGHDTAAGAGISYEF